jgi:hypothetical protein
MSCDNDRISEKMVAEMFSEAMRKIYSYDPRPAMCDKCGCLLGYHSRTCEYWPYKYELLKEIRDTLRE